MKLDFEEKLKNMNPKKMTPHEKTYMWSRIESKISPKAVGNSKSFWYTISLFNFRKYAFVPALIIAFLAGSLGTTLAFADNANPGDFLFPVDIATENILLTLTFGDNNDRLQLRFAEERLDEVKSLLALAVVVETTTSTDDNNEATSTDSGNANTTDDDSNNSNENVDIEQFEKAQSAFLVALAHLETAREKLIAKENELGVAVIDDMISELTLLAQEHTADLESYKVKVKANGKKVKISVEVKNDEIKTKFKFEQNLGRAKNDTEIEVSNNKSGSKVKISDGEFKISQSVKEQGRSNQKIKKSKNERVKICHKDIHTLEVSISAQWAHLDHGDSKGECDDEDKNNGDNDDITPPTISNLSASTSVTSTEISWNTDENTTSKVWYSTSTPVLLDSPTLFVSSDILETAHVLTLNSLSASTTYFIVVVATDEAGNATESLERTITTDPEPEPEDIAPPIISTITADARIEAVDIRWSTDEDADSLVWFGETTPLDPNSPTNFVSSGSSTKDHFLTIDGLTASTTYFFIVESKDSVGNTATSSEHIVTTNPEPVIVDETPPVISSITASTIASTTATISWSTDEDTDSTLYYGTDDPFLIETALSTADAIFTQDHSFDLTSLSASTTYLYILVSSDESENTATSSEQSFTTLGE